MYLSIKPCVYNKFKNNKIYNRKILQQHVTQLLTFFVFSMRNYKLKENRNTKQIKHAVEVIKGKIN